MLQNTERLGSFFYLFLFFKKKEESVFLIPKRRPARQLSGVKRFVDDLRRRGSCNRGERESELASPSSSTFSTHIILKLRPHVRMRPPCGSKGSFKQHYAAKSMFFGLDLCLISLFFPSPVITLTPVWPRPHPFRKRSVLLGAFRVAWAS